MKLLLSVLLFFGAASIAKAADTTRIYYSDTWEMTTSANASYYRDVWQEGTLWRVNDYYISGQLQMNGSYSDDSLKVKEGQFNYFHENGKRSKLATFVKGQEEGLVSNWYESGGLQSQEFYNHGETNGLTKRWFESGQLSDSFYTKKGQYDGYGIWYYENGQKSEESIYISGKAENAKLWKENGQLDADGKPGELMPSFETKRDQNISSYLIRVLRYPKAAREKSQEGRTIVEFTVSKVGRIMEARVKKSSGVIELDNEALRVINAMPDWNPGRYHNRAISVYYTLPISFRLS